MSSSSSFFCCHRNWFIRDTGDDKKMWVMRLFYALSGWQINWSVCQAFLLLLGPHQRTFESARNPHGRGGKNHRLACARRAICSWKQLGSERGDSYRSNVLFRRAMFAWRMGTDVWRKKRVARDFWSIHEPKRVRGIGRLDPIDLMQLPRLS